LCAVITGCTHYTWTTINGGTCWIKQGVVFKSDAIYTNDNSMTCGIVTGIESYFLFIRSLFMGQFFVYYIKNDVLNCS
jgi:hypothetical protein